jgi:hypothetical protein
MAEIHLAAANRLFKQTEPALCDKAVSPALFRPQRPTSTYLFPRDEPVSREPVCEANFLLAGNLQGIFPNLNQIRHQAKGE